MWTLRGTIRGDPQEPLCRVRSPLLFVRSVILTCNHNEAERSVWVFVPSSGKEQQCGSQSKMSGSRRHKCVCAKSARARARELVEALGTIAMQTHSSAGWFFHLRPFLVPKANQLISRCAESYFAETVIWSDSSYKFGRGGQRRKRLKMCIFAFRRQPLTATSSDRHHFSTKL